MVAVVAFAMPAAAIQMGDFDFRFAGYWHVAYFAHDNTITMNDDTPNPTLLNSGAAAVSRGDSDDASYLASRARWWFHTSYKGDYGGSLGFEVDAAEGGGQWGTNFAGTDQVAVETKHAYLWFKLPFYKALKFTMGLQDFGWFSPDGFLIGGFNGDFYGIRTDWAITKGWNFHWIYIQRGSGGLVSGAQLDLDDDVFYTGAKITGAPAPWLSFGVYWFGAFVGDQTQDNWDDSTGPTTVNNLGFQGAFTRERLEVRDADGNWVGFYFMLRPRPFGLRFHGNYFFGGADRGDTFNNVNAYRAFLGLPAVDEIDFGAFGMEGHAFVDIIPGTLQAGIIFWWFEGNSAEDWRDGDWGRWSTPDGIAASNTGILYAGLPTWRSIGKGFDELWTAPGGTWAIGADAVVTFTKTLKLFFRMAYLEWTDAFDKSTVFQLADLVKSAGVVDALGEPVEQDTTLGFEMNFRLDWRMYKHLLVRFGIDYLVSGDGLDSLHLDGTVNGSDDAFKGYWIVQLSW
jgi:hypothetical protein